MSLIIFLLLILTSICEISAIENENCDDSKLKNFNISIILGDEAFDSLENSLKTVVLELQKITSNLKNIENVRNIENLKRNFKEETLKAISDDYPIDEILYSIRNEQHDKDKIIQILYHLQFWDNKHWRENDNGIFKLAGEVSNLITGKEYDTYSRQTKMLLQAVKNMFPDGVQAVMWKNVCIKNLNPGFKDFHVFTEKGIDYLPSPNEDISVFVQRDNKRPTNGSIWKFEPVKESDTFEIKNLQTGEYLYATKTGFAPYNARYWKVLTKNTPERGDEFKWIVIPTTLSANEFWIKNEYYRDYLLTATWAAETYAKNRQTVTTFENHGGNPWFKWRFEVC